MSQNDFNLANASGASFRADNNSALQALASLSSGTSAPTTTYAHMLWADTTNNVLMRRNPADTGWIVVGTLEIDKVVAKTAAYTVTVAEFSKTLRASTTAAAWTLTLLAAATATEGWWFIVEASGAGGNVLTIDGNAAETINGAATLELRDGQVYRLVSDGTNFVAHLLNKNTLDIGRNAIINGNFNVWQRGTSFAAVANSTYTADRWVWLQSGAGVVTIKQETVTLPDGSVDIAAWVDVTTDSGGAPAAGDHYIFGQYVEGYNAVRFALGTSGAKQMTLSFWVSSPKTGTHCIAIQNSAANRSYVAEYTVDVADTWEKKIITLTGDVTGTWLTTNGVGIRVYFALAVGTTFHGTDGTWEAENDLSTVNQVNVMDNVVNNFKLAQVQLEVGSVATDFEHLDFATELARCQRYYWKTFPYGTAPAQNVGSSTGALGGRGDSNGSIAWNYHFPTQMRSNPAVTSYNPFAANGSARNTDDSTDTGLSTLSTPGDRGGSFRSAAAGDADNSMVLHLSSSSEL